MRKDAKKAGPSGCSRNEAFSLHEKFGLRNCLLPLDDAAIEVVREIKAYIGGHDGSILNFVSSEFSERCEEAYNTLGITRLTMENVWHVFTALIPLVFPQVQ